MTPDDAKSDRAGAFLAFLVYVLAVVVILCAQAALLYGVASLFRP